MNEFYGSFGLGQSACLPETNTQSYSNCNNYHHRLPVIVQPDRQQSPDRHEVAKGKLNPGKWPAKAHHQCAFTRLRIRLKIAIIINNEYIGGERTDTDSDHQRLTGH